MVNGMRLAIFPLLAGSLFGQYLVYVGTYTGPESKGIYAYRFEPKTGEVKPLGLAGEAKNPSFLAIHPNRKFLYSVGEAGDGGGWGGTVSAFALDRATGKLTFLNSASSGGKGPCHLVVDKTGKNLLVANYGSGATAVVPIKADGRLGEPSSTIQHSGSSVNPQRQQGPHAHSVNLSPDNRFAFVADLGLDKVLVYKLDAAKGTITPNTPPYAAVAAGSGPRHFAFHPSGKFAYVINEMGNTVTAFSYDAAGGVLTSLQTISTLPAGFSGTSYCAEVVAHPSGKFLYGSNRGHNSITVFAIDPAKGTLTAVEQTPTGGKWPRNFNIDPTGTYLFAANEQSSDIFIFRIDPASGRLKPTGKKLEVSKPVCIKFLPLK
jgi:6-phosphogluconolactonase